MVEVAVITEVDGWERLAPDPSGFVIRIARAAFAAVVLAADCRPVEMTVVLTDDARVQSLNRRWRGKDSPTNVLSFPIDGLSVTQGGSLPALLGDVVLALETVSSEALAQGKPFAHHVAHLVVHGVLHLLGFEHGSELAARRMEDLETDVLATLGIVDPYVVADASAVEAAADALSGRGVPAGRVATG